MNSLAKSRARPARPAFLCEAEPGFRLRDLWQAAALLSVLMLGLLISMLYPTGKDGQYAMVAPPWYSLGQSIALVQAADGRIVDMGGPSNVIIVHSARPDFVRRLYSVGAWLVIDPMQLRGCVGFQPAAAEART